MRKKKANGRKCICILLRLSNLDHLEGREKTEMGFPNNATLGPGSEGQGGLIEEKEPGKGSRQKKQPMQRP